MNGPPLRWDGGRLEGTPFQGILHLSIEFPEGGPEDGPRAVLTVHLNQPASGLSPDDVVVTGVRGTRVPRYRVDLAGSTAVLSFQDFGGQSSYIVQLVPGPRTTVALHPFFSSREFRFTIDCEVGDCRDPVPVATRPPEQPPAVDLLTKDFRGFRQLLADWVKVKNPHVADLSPASFERVLLDLLAWAGDLHSYYQDRVANEAFIDTASQRHSLRQHAVLLGTRLDDGQAPSTVLAFDVQASGYVPAGLEVRMRTSTDEVPVLFQVRRRSRMRVEHNSGRLRIAAWPGAGDAELPAGATGLLLLGHEVQLAPGDRLALVQGSFAQVVTLTATPRRVEQAGWVEHPDQLWDPAGPLARLTQLEWAEPLGQSLRPWAADPPLRLHANLADAGYGARRTAVIRPNADPWRPQQVAIRLDRANSIVQHRRVGEGHLLRALRVPEPSVVHEVDADGRGLPALEVFVDGQTWMRVEHLHRSRSYDPHYTAEPDNEGSVWLGFGDGVHGHEVPVDVGPGSRVTADVELRYRVGDPILGNVGLGTLTEVVAPVSGTDEEAALRDLGRVTVSNVLPGTGGRQPQTLASAREALPASLLHGDLQRAVALEDYAAVAMQVPGVARATARAAGGLFNTVVVLVDAEGAGDLDEALRLRVYEHLDGLRMAGREHVVVAAEYVALEVELLLCAASGSAPHQVRERVLAELKPGTGERPGWFHPDRLSFGDALRLGDLLAFVQGIAGVLAVKALAFRRRGDPGPAVQQTIMLGRTKVARLDADPDFPENGTLEVRVVGLDGDPGAFDVDLAAAGDSAGRGQ